MTVRPFRILLFAALLPVLLACGQRGPLYLPDEPQQEQQDETAPAR